MPPKSPLVRASDDNTRISSEAFVGPHNAAKPSSTLKILSCVVIWPIYHERITLSSALTNPIFESDTGLISPLDGGFHEDCQGAC